MSSSRSITDPTSPRPWTGSAASPAPKWRWNRLMPLLQRGLWSGCARRWQPRQAQPASGSIHAPGTSARTKPTVSAVPGGCRPGHGSTPTARVRHWRRAAARDRRRRRCRSSPAGEGCPKPARCNGSRCRSPDGRRVSMRRSRRPGRVHAEPGSADLQEHDRNLALPPELEQQRLRAEHPLIPLDRRLHVRDGDGDVIQTLDRHCRFPFSRRRLRAQPIAERRLCGS